MAAPASDAPFRAPLRHIFNAEDHAAFVNSPAHSELLKFVAALNGAVTDKSTRTDVATSAVVSALLDVLAQLAAWVDEIPPAQQAMRYGNKAFRTWHARLVAEAPRLCESLCHAPGAAGAQVELAPYLCDAFGNATRIDYGTGHETTFVVFLYCLCKLGLCGPLDLPALGLKVFPAYIDVARKLQRAYWLEPAGSHGVWSLDDYQFLVFLFGSAQLANHPRIKPRAIHSPEVMEAAPPAAGPAAAAPVSLCDEYMYLAAVRFIHSVKYGAPFAEHSPILNDIGELPSWGRVNDGLAKMYSGEVLGKLPVVQHFLFGTLFPASWTPSRPPVPGEAGAAHVLPGGAAGPWPASSSSEVPVDEPDRAVAPWVTSPPARHPAVRSPVVGDGNATDGVAPWARGGSSGGGGGGSPTAPSSLAAAGGSGADRAHHQHSAPAPGSPGAQASSTVANMLDAFGPLPHVGPGHAMAAAASAAAEAEAEAAAASAGASAADSECAHGREPAAAAPAAQQGKK